MEEQRVVGPRVLDQPMHRPDDVRLGRLAHRVLLVIRQRHHILPLVPEVLVQVSGHVLDVVDAPAQLPALPEVVDPDQQRLPAPRAVRVLELVLPRCARARTAASALAGARGALGPVVGRGIAVGDRRTAVGSPRIAGGAVVAVFNGTCQMEVCWWVCGCHWLTWYGPPYCCGGGGP